MVGSNFSNIDVFMGVCYITPEPGLRGRPRVFPSFLDIHHSDRNDDHDVKVTIYVYNTVEKVKFIALGHIQCTYIRNTHA